MTEAVSMFTFYALVLIAAGAAVAAAYAGIIEARRRTVMRRVIASADTPLRPAPMRKAARAPSPALMQRIGAIVPSSWLDSKALQSRLIQAGYDDKSAPQLFAAARLALLIGLPLVAVLLQIGQPIGDAALYVAGALGCAWIIPRGYLDGRIRQRQKRIRNAIPDALDLLIVCVEAGVSLDSALLRVAREIQLVHPELAYEFSIVLGKIKAGMPREEAMRELYRRTGVEELRTFVANVVQSERWGTSISRVLRVAADTLRRKRRQAAEKRAATAPIRMALPLVLLILPPLFAVVLGPSVMQLMSALRSTGG